jgi:hypothetical protein
MCIFIYDRYTDCEKDHHVEAYHRCLAAAEFVLDLNYDGCNTSRILYCLTNDPCPKCEHGSDCFKSEASASDNIMDISDDDGSSEDAMDISNDEESSGEESSGTNSATEGETSAMKM